MKTIGICVTGLVRTWDSCYKNLLKNLIETNPEYKFYLIGYIGDIENEKEFSDLYKFDILRVSTHQGLPDLEYQKNNYTHNLGSNQYINAFHQLKGLKEVGILLDEFEEKNNIVLDYIIRTRTDLDILLPIKLPSLKENTIYIPNGHDWYGYNDRFAYGNRNNLKIYLNRYDFWMNKNQKIPNYSTHIESNLKIYLDSHNISIERLNDLNYSFRRNVNGNEINVEGFYNGNVYMGPNNIINL